MGQLSDALLGVTTEREAVSRTTSVGTAAQKILDANPNRLQAVFINPTSTEIWIDTSADVTVGDGFPVPVSNGSIVFNITEDGDLPPAEWWAIAGSGGTTLVHKGEVVREPVGEALEETR